MRFSATHKLTSYLMVLAAVATLWFSPELSLWAKVLSLAGILLSWFVEPHIFPIQRLTSAWNLATVLFLTYLVIGVLQGESVINAGVYFLLFVLINKLFNRTSSRDYRQAYVISFLVLVAATTLNNDLSYAVFFCLYVLFATWALTLFHLRREMEENYLIRHSTGQQSEKVEVERILSSRRIVGPSFLASTALLSVGVVLCSGLIFFLFPRVGFGLFLGHRRVGVAMVGFRERVELGHHGVIRDNPQVVMRVVTAAGRPRSPLYWRGSVYDHYESGVWSHSEDLMGRTARVFPTEGLYLLNHAPGLVHPLSPALVRGHLFKHEIYLDPLDSTIIFGADRPVAVEVPRPALELRPSFVPRRGPLGEIHAEKIRTAGIRYVVYSHTGRVPSRQLRQAGPVTSPRWSRYLQLPATLPRRVEELARRITRTAPTIHDKVTAVQKYLQAHYTYSLELTHDRRWEPLDEFLFETRRGHCEYFASALAVLLRYVGIHTRQVNGLYGGIWNAYGRYLAVRQGDAHAWVEVLYSNVGWVAVDPTPPSGRREGEERGWTVALGQLVDTLRMRWFRYVVEYDLSKQVAILHDLSRLFQPVPRSWGGIVGYRPVLVTLSAVLVLAGGFLLVRRHLRRRGMPGASRPGAPLMVISQIYTALLRTLATHGQHKTPSATPLEFVQDLHAKGFSATELVQRFTVRYYAARFGEEAVSAPRIRELQSLLRELRASLGRKKT